MKPAALLGLLLAACSGGNAETVGTARSEIFGGSPAPDDDAVVGVVNFAGGQCSGSLIAPTLVLTARHCVADTAGQDVQVSCGETPFVPPDSAGALFVVPLERLSDDPKDYLAVAEIRVPEGVDDDLCGTDVALLRLEQPLMGVEPLEPRLDAPVEPGEVYSAVGFGADDALDPAPSGERKRLDGLEVRCSGNACSALDVRDSEWVGSGGPCSGDSGGPALDGRGRVIGVVSRGEQGCNSPVFSDVVTRAAWLREEAIAAANARRVSPPGWAPCTTEMVCEEPAAEDGPAESCGFAPPGTGRLAGYLGYGFGGAWLLLRKRRLLA